MRPVHALALAALSLAVSACGSAASPVAVAPAASPPPSAAREAGPAFVPVSRGPSEAIRSHWTFDDSVEVSLYIDLVGLLHSPVASLLASQLRGLATTQLNAQQLQCLDDVTSGARELLLGAKGDDGLVLIAFDESSVRPTTCLATFGATATTLDGASDAYKVSDGLLIHVPGLLIMGSDDLVKRAVAAAPRAPMATFALADDRYLAWRFQQAQVGSMHGGLVASADRFRVDFDGEVGEEGARKVEMQLSAVRGAPSLPGIPPAETKALQGLLQSLTVARDGGHLRVAYEVTGSADAQSLELMKAASLGVFFTRLYLADAKAAEARAVVRMIARDHVAAWEQEDPKARARKRFASYPAVPTAVPKGVKASTTLADWKAWAPLHFNLDGGIYYQYEVKAAKNGTSAVISARGDLNGDGKTSLFKLGLHLDPKEHKVVVDDHVEEIEPRE